MDKKYLGYYRDDQGRSPLIHAIQKQNLEIVAFLIEKFPFLLKINDAVRFLIIF
jgi:ankyrin repeat protein